MLSTAFRSHGGPTGSDSTLQNSITTRPASGVGNAKDWGFAMGHGKVRLDNDTDPGHVVGLVIAVPAAGGAWSVVAVHYTAQ